MIAAAKPLCMTRPAVMARRSLVSRKSSLVVVRAEPQKAQPSAEPMTNEDGTVFYGGRTFASEAEVCSRLFSSCLFDLTQKSISCYQHHQLLQPCIVSRRVLTIY